MIISIMSNCSKSQTPPQTTQQGSIVVRPAPGLLKGQPMVLMTASLASIALRMF
jgi:hypothetical protein